jgi:hypothetical protein
MYYLPILCDDASVCCEISINAILADTLRQRKISADAYKYCRESFRISR